MTTQEGPKKVKYEEPKCPACQVRYLDCAGHMGLRESIYESGVARATDPRIQKTKGF